MGRRIFESRAKQQPDALPSEAMNGRTRDDFIASVTPHISGIAIVSAGVQAPPNRVPGRVVEEKGMPRPRRLSRKELLKQKSLLIEKARTDDLTGLLLKGPFTEQVVAMTTQTGPENKTPSHHLLFMDLDFFRQTNDALGHPATDALVLGPIGQILQDELQSDERNLRGALAGRYGGDEFVVFLPDTDQAAAVQIATSMQDRINAISYPDGKFVAGRSTVGVSIGVSAFPQGSDFKEIITLADDAMYASKATSTKNQITYTYPSV